MAILPIFCVARSSRTDLSMLVARALKIGKIADGGMPPTYGTMHYCTFPLNEGWCYAIGFALGSIQVLHQTLDAQFAERSKILLHRRKRRPKKSGFRDIIKT